MGHALVPERRYARPSRSAVFRRFGIGETLAALRMQRAKLSRAVRGASRDDMRRLLAAIGHICKERPTHEGAAVAAACLDAFRQIRVPVKRPQALGWMRTLCEALVWCHSHAFHVNGPALAMARTVVGAADALFLCLEGCVLDCVLSTFVLLAAHYFGDEATFHQLAVLAAAGGVDTRHALVGAGALRSLFCVCVTELLAAFIDVVHKCALVGGAAEARRAEGVVLAVATAVRSRQLASHCSALRW